jgi:hypothetical protein
LLLLLPSGKTVRLKMKMTGGQSMEQ